MFTVCVCTDRTVKLYNFSQANEFAGNRSRDNPPVQACALKTRGRFDDGGKTKPRTIPVSSWKEGRLIIPLALVAPAGISPRGEIPRRHLSNSLVYFNILYTVYCILYIWTVNTVLKRTVCTVQIYSQYSRKNLDLHELGPRGIGR